MKASFILMISAFILVSVKLYKIKKYELVTAINISPKQIYMGELFVDEGGSQSFSIENVGEIDFHIDTIISDCHCTLPNEYPLKIRSGEEALISFEVVKELPGFFTQNIYIHGNIEPSPQVIMIDGTFIAQESEK